MNIQTNNLPLLIIELLNNIRTYKESMIIKQSINKVSK